LILKAFEICLRILWFSQNSYFGPFLPQNDSITPSSADYDFLKSARERKIWKYKILLYFNPLEIKAFLGMFLQAPPPIFSKGIRTFSLKSLIFMIIYPQNFSCSLQSPGMFL
jgi:hypothetical protein